MKLLQPISLAVLLLVLGCNKEPAKTTPKKAKGGGPGAAATESVDLAGAKAYYTQTCMTCHGKTGHGDGDSAAALKPKPRNLSDKTWQATVDDAYLKKVIQFGGAAVGKSPTMPPNPQLADKKAVINGLVKVVRGFAK